VGTKHGFFRPDLLWPIAMGGMYLFSLLILLYVIQQRLQVSVCVEPYYSLHVHEHADIVY
jgi:hypothetical protein